jgi:hypothetical protein
MSGEDFVTVQLTETGRELCGEGELHVIKGQHHFTFKRDDVQRLTKAFDWQRVLAVEFRDGKPLFEIVDGQPGATVSEDYRETR